MSEYEIRTYGEVEGEDRSDLAGQVDEQRARVRRRLEEVDRLVAVMSGKGGVGKSFVATGLAASLAAEDERVGLVDADLDSPTAARMLGADRTSLRVGERGVAPVEAAGVRLISTDLLLEADAPLRWREPDGESFVWRGAQEQGVLREFLGDVTWGRLDWLVVDLPPGTGRLEQLLELVPEPAGLAAVTLPGEASRTSVERSLRLAADRDAPLAGVVENMAGYTCPGCGRTGGLFPGDAGERLAERFAVPLLGSVPFDPDAARLAGEGRPADLLAETAAGEALRAGAPRLAGAVPAPGTEEGDGG